MTHAAQDQECAELSDLLQLQPTNHHSQRHLHTSRIMRYNDIHNQSQPATFTYEQDNEIQ